MVLCLGFALNTVIRGIFIISEQDLHRTTAFSTFCTATGKEAGDVWEIDRRHSQERRLQETKEIFQTLYSVYKVGRYLV